MRSPSTMPSGEPCEEKYRRQPPRACCASVRRDRARTRIGDAGLPRYGKFRDVARGKATCFKIVHHAAPRVVENRAWRSIVCVMIAGDDNCRPVGKWRSGTPGKRKREKYNRECTNKLGGPLSGGP